MTANCAITLAFAGDVMLGRRLRDATASEAPEAFWGDMLPVLRAADAVCANLESPITTSTTPGDRATKVFRFRAEPQAIEVLRAGNIKAVNLANNHILDFGEAGLRDTTEQLSRAGISFFGAGLDGGAAEASTILKLQDRDIAFLGCTDTMPEWAAGARKAGVHYVSHDRYPEVIAALTNTVSGLRQQGIEFIVMSMHWGPNLTLWPRDSTKAFCRQIIDGGISLIHGHSAHLLHGLERYREGLVLYDTGDFLDDYWVFPGIRTDRTCLFLVELRAARIARLRVIPAVIANCGVRRAKGREFEEIRDLMIRKSRSLGTELSPTDEGLELVFG